MSASVTEAIRIALEMRLERRDTNDGKPYCLDCGANKRRNGTYKHDGECSVTVAVDAARAALGASK